MLGMATITHRRVLPALLGMALVAAACGTSNKTSTPPASSGSNGGSSATSEATSMAATVRVTRVAGVGDVLVSHSGRTLYLLTSDRQSKPTCSSAGGCTQYWPPLLSGGAPLHAGAGIQSSMLGEVSVAGEGEQVTYNHWPLYMYAGDSGTGQSNGEGIRSFGGTWYAVSASGRAAMGGSSGSPTTTSKVYGGY
jgi:predicted lipoprotein with Yx(FWY)xxD motif